MDITGIILAGGKSSRMGQDKGLIDYEGKKLVEYAIELLLPLCSEIMISTNETGYEKYGFKTIFDNFSDCGPIGGIEASLKQSQTDFNIIISCDTPFLHPDLFYEMIVELSTQDAIIPTHSKGLEPLAGIYRKSLAGFFYKKILENDFKIRKVICERNVQFFDAEKLVQEYPKLFYNLNTQEDLKRY